VLTPHPSPRRIPHPDPAARGNSHLLADLAHLGALVNDGPRNAAEYIDHFLKHVQGPSPLR
jgi:hypothetical protein